MSGAVPRQDPPPQHWADDRPFLPAPPLAGSDAGIGAWRMMLRRFRRRRIAFAAFCLLALTQLLVVPCAESLPP